MDQGLPEIITGTDATARGIDWDVEATDLITRADIAAELGVSRLKIDNAQTRPTPATRRRKRTLATMLPPMVARGVYPASLYRLAVDPQWRPTVGNTGRVWRSHGVIVVPTIDDLILTPEIAERAKVTESGLRSMLASTMTAPVRLQQLPDVLSLTSQVRYWSRRAVDALDLAPYDPIA